MRISWRYHALEQIAERSFEREWIERTILAPEWTEPDRRYPELTRLFRAIPECGGRFLRVVVAYEDVDRCRVITVLLDCDARRPR